MKQALLMFFLSLILAPLLTGVINRVKALAAGRRGPPLLQHYYDLAKLARKEIKHPRCSSWVFRAGPAVAFAGSLAAAVITPFGYERSVVFFPGDFLIWVGAFGLARLFMVLAALDSGSAFEGMGASREAWFGALAEPAILLSMAALALVTGGESLSGFLGFFSEATWRDHFVSLLFAALALFLTALAENARIPVDDPNTHLELTMIHEAMLLDHGGPDLALAEYAASLKLWIMGALVVGFTLPARHGGFWLDAVIFLVGMLAFAALIGVVESRMARLRMSKVRQFLAGAAALAVLSLLMAARNL